MMKTLKKIVGLICVLLLAMYALVGCGTDAQKDGQGITIYTSIYPVYDFTCKIAGEHATVVNLVPAGEEAHDFELGTQDMVKLASADMLVYSGSGMEHWIDKTVEALGSEELVVVEASSDIALLETGDETDPHVWLSPANAIMMMKNIKDALCQVDAVNASVYEANFEFYKKELEQLDAEYQDALATVGKTDVVVDHASFGYLCDAYHLNQVAVEGLMAHSEPDPATMSHIIEYIRDHQVTTVFYVEQGNTKVVDTLSKETGVAIARLEALEGLSQDRIDAGEDYFSVMRQNLQALKTALQ